MDFTDSEDFIEVDEEDFVPSDIQFSLSLPYGFRLESANDWEIPIWEC